MNDLTKQTGNRTLRRPIPVAILTRCRLSTANLRPHPCCHIHRLSVLPMNLVRSVMIAETIDVDPVVPVPTLVLARVDPSLLAGSTDRVLYIAVVADMPVVDLAGAAVAVAAAAAKVCPFEAVGALVVYAAAGWE